MKQKRRKKQLRHKNFCQFSECVATRHGVAVQAIVRLHICHKKMHLIGEYKQGKQVITCFDFCQKVKSTFRGERKFGIKRDRLIRVKFPL